MNTKISLEIDLKDIIGTVNHYDEDGDICEVEDKNPAHEMQKLIANKVAKTINVESKIDAMIDKTLSERVNDIIDLKMSNFLEEYINKEIVVTDSWGKEKSRGTITDKINERFDSYLTETVDNDGRESSRHGCMKRIDFVVDKRLEKLKSSFMETSLKRVNDAMSGYIDKVDEAVQREIKNAVQSRIGEKLYDNLDIGNLIENIKKGK
jgi:membrane-associated HD superfamily phosphohydrolase